MTVNEIAFSIFSTIFNNLIVVVFIIVIIGIFAIQAISFINKI